MDFLTFMMSRPKTRNAGPFKSGLVPRITIPKIGGTGGMEKVTEVPIPQSGMERASWWESNAPRFSVSETKPSYCSATGGASIGKYERMVQGVERDDAMGMLVIRDKNYFDYREPETTQSDDVGKIWAAQVSASDGLWDGNGEVYVSQDATSIWA